MASPTPPGALSPSIPPKLVPQRPTAPPSSVTRPAAGRAAAEATNATDAASTLDAALDATHRSSDSLSSLLETLGRFTSGIHDARETSEQLRQDLSMLRDLLAAQNQERLALEVRVEHLELELDETRNYVEQEQRYVRDEQDRFIAALMEEYETEVEQLKQLLTVSEPLNPAITSRELRNALEAVEVAQAEREHSRDLAHRAQRQRDSAQREVLRLQHELRLAQGRLTELMIKFDDQHTRPTEPPPNDGPPARRASARASADTDPAPRALSVASLKLEPVPRALDLADFERDWDAAAIPAPPPSFEGAAALPHTTNEAPPRHSPSPHSPSPHSASRPSAAPAELRAALTRSSPAMRRASTPPAPGGVPSGSPAPASPVEVVPPADETPSIVTNMRPSSVYPDPYRVDAKPALKRKPHHTERPLVGYSKRADEIQPEQLGATAKGTDRDRDPP